MRPHRPVGVGDDVAARAALVQVPLGDERVGLLDFEVVRSDVGVRCVLD
jgi:hypothetical protein